MKRYLALFAIMAFVFGVNTRALAHSSNLYLSTTLKTIDKDVAVTLQPTTALNPTQVKDEVIVEALARTRTAAFQIQLINDRAGKFESGALVKNEMTPSLDDETPEEQKQIMDTFLKDLPQAKAKLVTAEQQLRTEYGKASNQRDFRALKATLDALDVILTDISSIIG